MSRFFKYKKLWYVLFALLFTMIFAFVWCNRSYWSQLRIIRHNAAHVNVLLARSDAELMAIDSSQNILIPTTVEPAKATHAKIIRIVYVPEKSAIYFAISIDVHCNLIPIFKVNGQERFASIAETAAGWPKKIIEFTFSLSSVELSGQNDFTLDLYKRKGVDQLELVSSLPNVFKFDESNFS